MTAIDFTIALKRYTPATTRMLAEIAGTMAQIQASNILLPAADVVRSKALVETIHYSNMIEGNELPKAEAQRAARGQLDNTSKMKIELINYVSALELIDKELASGSLELTPEFVKRLHGVVTKGLGREDEPFKPHHEGSWRDGMAVVHHPITREIIHEGAKPEEVPGRIEGLFDWVAKKTDHPDWNPYVVAGVLHHAIANIHPFADGNGRMARLMQMALLLKANAIPGRFISFDRYYATDTKAYYTALKSADGPLKPMNEWMEYFLEGIVVESSRALETITEIEGTFEGARETKSRLNDTQVRAILALSDRREFTRNDYQSVTGLSRNKAVADLRQLKEAGIIFQVGAGSSATYSKVRPTDNRGRKKEWTNERIESELRSFLGGRDTWPTRAEFVADNDLLYQAMSRSGGIKRWRSHFKL